MKQEELEAFLGRSLTQREVTNMTIYLDIARQSLEELVCMEISCESVEEPRIVSTRVGYSTVFTDVFTDVDSVTINGEEVDSSKYYKAFFDSRNGKFFNSIVFNEAFYDSDGITITATWGFQGLPNDLGMLMARLFSNVSKKYSVGSGNVKSKRVRNFQVTYGDLTDDQAFIDANSRTIQKYNMCNIGFIRSGSTCSEHGRLDCGCV